MLSTNIKIDIFKILEVLNALKNFCLNICNDSKLSRNKLLRVQRNLISFKFITINDRFYFKQVEPVRDFVATRGLRAPTLLPMIRARTYTVK